MVALITPLTESGDVDIDTLLALVERHIEAGTQAVILYGSTGEGITLTDEERASTLKRVIAQVRGRIPVIAGTGSASTADTIRRTADAHQLGADAALIVTPYYNRPTQEGLYQHFAAVAAQVPIPIVLYTVPTRTAVDFSVDTLKRLAQIPNIIGLKDARGDLSKQREIASACGDSFALYSGDDPSALAFMCQGGRGVISITANAAPQLMAQMCSAALSKNVTLAGELNTRLMPLHKAMMLEPNPIPIKWALTQMGWIKNGIRLPLTTLSACYHAQVREALQIAGVLACAD
jgi:4-hydroxy-tetrahydrodipicolinate synthase